MNQGCDSEVRVEGTHLRIISEVELSCVGDEVEGRGRFRAGDFVGKGAIGELGTQEKPSPRRYNILRVSAFCSTAH